MCGIFGISQIEKVKDSAIEEMFRGLKVRGPDAQNACNVSKNLVFGMTRLAINGMEIPEFLMGKSTILST
jgi:asparagine synthetase B (glutamine-hydrolysing)